MNQLRMQRLSLYMLKRAYGSPIDIYKLVSSETDVLTGVRTTSVSRYHIRRAVVLPTTTVRKALTRRTGVSVAGDFPASGSFDIGKGCFIVDRNDVPTTLKLTQEDWIVYLGRKYPVETAEEFEMGGWIITVGELTGEVPTEIIGVRVDSTRLLTTYAIDLESTLALTDTADES